MLAPVTHIACKWIAGMPSSMPMMYGTSHNSHTAVLNAWNRLSDRSY